MPYMRPNCDFLWRLFMPRTAKVKYLLLMMFFYLGSYLWIQAAVTAHKFDFLTSYDIAIPFMPEFIWIYHSILPAVALSMILLVRTREVFLNTFWAAIITTVILNISYVLLPSFYPRMDFEINTISEAVLAWTRQIDASNNTFPSGHVSFAWLLCMGVWNSLLSRQFAYIKWVYFLWAIAISLSTLVLKQHYIIDVLSGIILASLCFYLAKPAARLHGRLIRV
jgi:membrane-associated phospholipid phosphatase